MRTVEVLSIPRCPRSPALPFGVADVSIGQLPGNSPVVLTGADPCGNIALVPVCQERLCRHFPKVSVRACLKNGRMPNGERFFCQPRRFDAAILCVWQGKSTQSGGKDPPFGRFDIFQTWPNIPHIGAGRYWEIDLFLGH